MKKDKRFVRIYKQGHCLGNGVDIIVDKNSGVHYVYAFGEYGGGLTPLLDENGNIVIDKNVLESLAQE